MKKQNDQGITIISLVVTIIVLMILAGVSISALVGENGVVNNAKTIQNDTYYQIASEEVNQLVLEYKLRKEDATLEEFLASKVPSRIDEVTRKDDNTLIVKKNGYEIEVEVGSESKTLTLYVVPYIGTYDGQPHDMLTSVSVSPSDAKIEYSIDNGKTYIDKMPQITNVSSVSVIVRASKTKYETKTVMKTAIVNKAEGSLKLSASSGTITYPSTSTTFTVSGNTGTLSVTSSNNNVATASISENTVTVKSLTTAGIAKITVTCAATTNYNEATATYTVTISNGYVTANTKKTYSDGDVWIPEGFRISKYSASTVQDGIVIEDKDLNQFVWVPVSDIANYKRTWYSGYDKFSAYSESLPGDEKTSVTTYKGFYIGRYEAGDKESTASQTLRSSSSNSSNTVTIKVGQAPYNYVSRSQAKTLAETFGTKQSYKAKTKLVSSYAWDTTVAFLQKKISDYGTSSPQGNYNNVNAFDYTDIKGNKQNGKGILIPTGQTTPVCNIYDMGGNVWEWTTEAYTGNGYPYARHGGGYKEIYSKYSAGYRNDNSSTAVDIGFRIALFL